MIIKVSDPYNASLVGHTTITLPDGKSIFKIYFLSRLGRGKPELYEWEHSILTRETFETTFLASGQEGVGFVIAFPHVTKVFRFSPEKETILDVREYITRDMVVRDCSQDDGFHEFACFAEAVIAAEEYKAWAGAESVEEFLKFRCSSEIFPVHANRKLKDYWESQ